MHLWLKFHIEISFKVLQKAGHHMEDTLIAAYTALLTGYCIMEDEVWTNPGLVVNNLNFRVPHTQAKLQLLYSSNACVFIRIVRLRCLYFYPCVCFRIVRLRYLYFIAVCVSGLWGWDPSHATWWKLQLDGDCAEEVSSVHGSHSLCMILTFSVFEVHISSVVFYHLAKSE